MLLTNLNKRSLGSVKINLNGASAISNLFGIGSPSGISLKISKAIINSINGVAGRNVSNVSIESLKAILPFVANNNSPATIVGPMGVCWIRASLNNVFPYLMNSRPGHPVRFICSGGPLLLKTAAGLGGSAFKVWAKTLEGIAAIALAGPNAVAIGRFANKGSNGKSSELFSNDINYMFRHSNC